jgi:hypothetical protein
MESTAQQPAQLESKRRNEQIAKDDLVLARFKSYEDDLKTYEFLRETGQLDADMRRPTPPTFGDLF